MMTSTQAPAHFGVATDYDYKSSHKRDRIVVWSGPFMENYEAEGLSLPKDNGYMLTTYNGDKVRVECESPRTDLNYEEVDFAVSLVLAAHYSNRGTIAVMPELEPISQTADLVVTEPVYVIWSPAVHLPSRMIGSRIAAVVGGVLLAATVALLIFALSFDWSDPSVWP